MKKELLMASALVASMGYAGVASAIDPSFSGHVRAGVESQDTDAGGDETVVAKQLGKFTVSLSEVTDGGITIATGFDLTNENDAVTDNSGLTLTFNSGAKLDLIEAGNAATSQLATVPGASGEQGIGVSTGNAAPTALSYGDTSDAVGFELHSAADAFGVDGLKLGISASFNDDVASNTSTTGTSTTSQAFSIGASYVADAGDTKVTIGGGIVQAEGSNTTAAKDQASVGQISLSAVTGDLTIGVGYASGDYIDTQGATAQSYDVGSSSFMSAGAKYVSGDMTFAIGVSDGEGTDATMGTAQSGSPDSRTKTAASVDYTVASGITATIGFSSETSDNDGTKTNSNSGTAWYVGATVSF